MKANPPIVLLDLVDSYYLPSFQPSQSVEELTSLFSLQFKLLQHILYRCLWNSVFEEAMLQIFDDKSLNLATFPRSASDKNGHGSDHPLGFFLGSPRHFISLLHFILESRIYIIPSIPVRRQSVEKLASRNPEDDWFKLVMN